MPLPDGRVFGDVRLSRLTWQDIEEMYAAMRASGRGPDWIRRCATVLNRTLELARKRGLLDANPSKDAARPRSTRTKPFAPTGEEVRTSLAAARQRDPETADLVTVVASTGLRVGELLALRWVDVDLVAGELHIAAAITIHVWDRPALVRWVSWRRVGVGVDSRLGRWPPSLWW